MNEQEQQMHMYVWESEALKNWGRGHIVVMAIDVEDARKRVMEQIDIAHAQRDDHGDDEIKRRIDKYNKDERDLYMEDISKDPQVIGSGIYFIQGSS